MSENAITLVELDVTPEIAERVAGDITAWLLSEGTVVQNPTLGLHQPSALIPGPTVADVAPDHWQFDNLSNSGVDVIANRQVHHPVENYEPPPCPVCATPIDADLHYSLLEGWLAGVEPTVTCENCGAANRIGDWVHEFTFYVANLAVRFNNWSPLSEEFTARLGGRLGSRWRVVLEHS
jgi:hypothetical protein